MNKSSTLFVMIVCVGLVVIGLSGCTSQEKQDQADYDSSVNQEMDSEPVSVETLPDVNSELDELDLEVDESALLVLEDW